MNLITKGIQAHKDTTKYVGYDTTKRHFSLTVSFFKIMVFKS